MKIQDILFFIVTLSLIFFRNPRIFAIAGIVCLILAMPLFYFWVFFTAERLTWYAAAFFFLSVLFYMGELRKVQ